MAAEGLAATGSKQLQQLRHYVITKLHRQLVAWHAHCSAVSCSCKHVFFCFQLGCSRLNVAYMDWMSQRLEADAVLVLGGGERQNCRSHVEKFLLLLNHRFFESLRGRSPDSSSHFSAPRLHFKHALHLFTACLLTSLFFMWPHSPRKC